MIKIPFFINSILLPLALLLIVVQLSFSQELQPRFVHRIGTPKWDGVSALCIDSSSNYYIAAGFTNSAVVHDDTTLFIQDTISTHIIKYDNNNSVKQITNVGKAQITLLSSDKHENIYGFGYCSNDSISGGILSKDVRINDTVLHLLWYVSDFTTLFKLDPSGRRKWSVPLYSNDKRNGPSVLSLHTSSLKNIFLYGFFRDSLMIGDSLFVGNYGIHSLFIAKFDSNGILIWCNTTKPTDLGTYPATMQVNESEDVYITGRYDSNMTFDHYSISDTNHTYKSFLARFDSFGKLQYLKNIYEESTSNSFQYIPYFYLGKDQNLYFYTDFTSDYDVNEESHFTIFDTTLYSYGINDCLVLKVHPDGKMAKAIQFGGNNEDHLYQVGAVSGNTIYAVTYFSDSARIRNSYYSSKINTTSFHAYMLELDTNLEFISITSIPLGVISYPGIFQKLANEDFISSYNIREVLKIGKVSYPNLGDTTKDDIVIIRSDPNFATLEMPQKTFISTEVDIAPNPSSFATKVYCTLPSPSLVTITIHDILGREVMRNELGMRGEGSHEETLDVSELPIGSYIVKISTNQEVFTSRISVVR